MCKNELLLVQQKEIFQKVKEMYSKEKLLSIVYKTKRQSSKSDTETYQKKKKTKLKSTKEKGSIQYKKGSILK